jgi:NAD(P)-dependent dehydrogenase (short-subunit alcohol dehydrogenase family)
MPENGCVIVIGGAGGVGKALIERLGSGCEVVVASRDASQHQGLGSESFQCDARNISDVDALVKEATQRHGAVRGLVNLAGSILLKPAHLISEDEWNDTIATNLTTAFATVRAAGKHMKEGGSVVLVSTVAAGTGLPNHEAIAAAKAGIEGLARSAAATYAGRGLRFNVVAPGLVDTPLAERITKSERTLEHSRKMHPLGRIGVPGDIAEAINFLLGPESDWITGQVLGIDGGLGATRAGAV